MDTAIAAVPAAPNEITSLVLAARDYADAGAAANTRRAYSSDWSAFTSWCASVGAVALPASPATVALYLTSRAGSLAVSTLARHMASIRAAHLAAGHAAPAGPELGLVWAGIRRKNGRPPRKKRGLGADDLAKVLKRLPPGLAGIRDRALLLTGYAGALRRSELAALSIGDADADVRVVFVAEGFELHIGRAKGDQLGRGAIVAVPYGKRMCPVAALQAWLKAAGVTAGPVWREVHRSGALRPGAIGEKAIARLVKRAVRRAGFDDADFAGHSLRRGMITTAARGGAAPDVLQRHARHARFETTLGYIEEADRFRKNAAGRAGL